MSTRIEIVGCGGRSFAVVDANDNCIMPDVEDQIVVPTRKGSQTKEELLPYTPERIRERLKAVGLNFEDWRKMHGLFFFYLSSLKNLKDMTSAQKVSELMVAAEHNRYAIIEYVGNAKSFLLETRAWAQQARVQFDKIEKEIKDKIYETAYEIGVLQADVFARYDMPELADLCLSEARGYAAEITYPVNEEGAEKIREKLHLPAPKTIVANAPVDRGEKKEKASWLDRFFREHGKIDECPRQWTFLRHPHIKK